MCPIVATKEQKGNQVGNIQAQNVSATKELAERTYKIRFTETDWGALSSFAASQKRDVAGVVRDAIKHELQGAIVEQSTIALPILASIPAGNLEEAFSDNPSKILVNNDWQSELGITENDVLFYVHGQSMEMAHIPDGSLIVVEPIPRHRPPRAGKPAVVQIVDEHGDYHVTLKKWGMKDGKPHLLDGNDKPVKLGFEPREMWAFGVVKRAIITF